MRKNIIYKSFTEGKITQINETSQINVSFLAIGYNNFLVSFDKIRRITIRHHVVMKIRGTEEIRHTNLCGSCTFRNRDYCFANTDTVSFLYHAADAINTVSHTIGYKINVQNGRILSKRIGLWYGRYTAHTSRIRIGNGRNFHKSSRNSPVIGIPINTKG